MQINKEKTMVTDNLLQHLIVESMSNALKGDKFAEFLDKCDYDKKEAIEVKLLVEGTEFPIDEVMEEWQEQITTMVNTEAIRILNERFLNITDTLDELRTQFVMDAGERLGLKMSVEDCER